MSIHEANSRSLDFETVAEQTTMHKVIDIHKAQLLKHGFVRFGPMVVQKNNIFYFHDNKDLEDSSVDRLRGILLYGLVAAKLAKRARIPISRNWSDPINESGISLTGGSESIRNSFELAIVATTHFRDDVPSKIPHENLYVVIINPNVDTVAARSGELIKRHRIPPRFFNGIIILDRVIRDSMHVSRHVDFESSSVQQTVRTVLSTMTSTCKSPNLAIPIYGISGSLYWPRQMSYEEVQNFVGERRNNGVQTSHRA